MSFSQLFDIVPSSQSPPQESIPSSQDLCTCGNQAAHWDDTSHIHTNLPARCLLYLSTPGGTQEDLASNCRPAPVTHIKAEPLDDLLVPDQAPNDVPAAAPALIDNPNPNPKPDVAPAYVGEDVANFFNLPHVANNRVRAVARNQEDTADNDGAEVHPPHAGNGAGEDVGQVHNAHDVVMRTTDEEEDISWMKRKRGADGFQVDETRSWKKTKKTTSTISIKGNGGIKMTVNF
ncbi:hypothetical protein BJ165DRAFT_1409164 [Panaeolus papilionaceus]|nr:hypothetical protein BJ165DRAFT_1409164 [Panaeolus papilionaceus]